jgi:hypothetical protein
MHKWDSIDPLGGCDDHDDDGDDDDDDDDDTKVSVQTGKYNSTMEPAGANT